MILHFCRWIVTSYGHFEIKSATSSVPCDPKLTSDNTIDFSFLAITLVRYPSILTKCTSSISCSSDDSDCESNYSSAAYSISWINSSTGLVPQVALTSISSLTNCSYLYDSLPSASFNTTGVNKINSVDFRKPTDIFSLTRRQLAILTLKSSDGCVNWNYCWKRILKSNSNLVPS